MCLPMACQCGRLCWRPRELCFFDGADVVWAHSLLTPCGVDVVFKDNAGLCADGIGDVARASRKRRRTTTWTATSANYAGGAAVLVIKG